MDIIPNAVSLTVYSGGAEDFLRNTTPIPCRTSRGWHASHLRGTRFPPGSDRRCASLHGGEFRRGKDRRTDLL